MRDAAAGRYSALHQRRVVLETQATSGQREPDQQGWTADGFIDPPALGAAMSGDPSVLLTEIRNALLSYDDGADVLDNAEDEGDEHEGEEMRSSALAQLRESISALDNILSRGGPLPDSWRHAVTSKH
ncbi:hypothetical protein [Amycolatopsis sp. MJM2582]|uniref:hypothetical protein n=1 Tax=Amycolatopsis sp. MJM2582 TaxID=1427749 RepID=UPI00126A790D|nr:hypothetical protein [Amycolatopsis sp. MJM2582]